jgi:molybdenum cofactor cytidylyltransferase
VILAAGQSRRMGRPKLLLPWKQTTVLGHLMEQWKKLPVRQLAVVCSETARELHADMDRLGLPASNRIINPAPERGMFSSIQCAGNWPGWKPELTHWLITLGDQPHLRIETLQTLLEFGSRNSEKICQPLRKAHRRHPVLMPKRVFAELANPATENLKSFLEAHASALAGFECDDAGLDSDLDTPEDYERLKR